MCDCWRDIKEGLKEKHFPDAESISNMNLEYLSGRTFSTYEVKLPGKKKPKTVPVLHSYCPHCGKKYDVEKEDTHA